MPIDADRFLAKIRGESNETPADFDAAQMPGRREETLTTNIPVHEPHGNSMLGTKLEAVTAKSLSNADEILDIPLDPERRHYQAELRARASIINTTLNTQARVGESALHKEVVDRLPEIIRLIQEEEARRRLNGSKPPPKTADELRQDAMEDLHLREVVRQIQDGKQDDG